MENNENNYTGGPVSNNSGSTGTKAVLSLVFAIIAFVMSFISSLFYPAIIGIVLGIVAIILAVGESKENPGNGLATAGLVVGIISLVLNAICLIACGALVGMAACTILPYVS